MHILAALPTSLGLLLDWNEGNEWTWAFLASTKTIFREGWERDWRMRQGDLLWPDCLVCQVVTW